MTNIDVLSSGLLIVWIVCMKTPFTDRQQAHLHYSGLIYKFSSVSNYSPNFVFLPLSLPDMMLKLLRFIAAFSGGLAVVNLVPSYLLDGHHIARYPLISYVTMLLNN